MVDIQSATAEKKEERRNHCCKI